MTKTRLILAIAVVGAAWQGYGLWRLRPVHPPDGALAPAEPVQIDAGDARPLIAGAWRLTPRARYDITARVLGREDYRFDALADLVPEDLALGWGPMSDNRVLRGFEITQGARFYAWRSRGELAIPRRTVIEHSANTHVIPADPAIRERLERMRVGERVHLKGLLVDARRTDGSVAIRTSLTRGDSGAGACEVLYVQEVDTP